MKRFARLPLPLRRRGISLLEVLISMFVLLVGLAGIASLLPAGRSEIMQGVKLDYSMRVGRDALREVQVRQMLDPSRWTSTDASGSGSFSTWDTSDPTKAPFVLPNVSASNRVVMPVVIDPLGLKAPGGAYGNKFPAESSIVLDGQSLVRINVGPITTSTYQAAENIFRCGDDLNLIVNAVNKKDPPQQQILSNKRFSDGNYSWIATVIPEPTAVITRLPVVPRIRWTVSVAVFYKRDLSAAGAGEKNVCNISSFPGTGISGGEVILDAPPKAVKPGQWIMLAGTVPFTDSTPPPITFQLRHYRWYRVLAASPIEGGKQNATIHGADWSVPAASSKAWLLDNVIAVYEKSMDLEF